MSRLKFAFFFSLSLAASYTVTSTPAFYSFRKLNLRSSASPPAPKASAADLLALLGPPQQASAVNSQEARQLRSCFKFLVPFLPSSQTPNRRSLRSKLRNERRSRSEENELIWLPPAPVLELARLAVDSGGDTASIQRTLDPTIIPVSFHIFLFVNQIRHLFICSLQKHSQLFNLIHDFVIKISSRIIYYGHLI